MSNELIEEIKVVVNRARMMVSYEHVVILDRRSVEADSIGMVNLLGELTAGSKTTTVTHVDDPPNRFILTSIFMGGHGGIRVYVIRGKDVTEALPFFKDYLDPKLVPTIKLTDDSVELM